jgi:hypothetical protein
METINQEVRPINFVKEGVKIGLINGAIALILMYGSYFAGLNAFITEEFISKFIPYMMIILIIYGLQLRKKNGGYLAFKEGLQYGFISYVIVAIIVGIGTYVLFNLIDKDLTQKVYDISLTRYKNMGMKEEDLEKLMGKREDQKTGASTIFLGTGFSLILSFIASLIVSLIIRREKPVF